jgi:hypothetical protein
MSDRERQLESEVAWLRYGYERMELALRERNAVIYDDHAREYGDYSKDPTTTESGDDDEDKPEFKHAIVCGCKQCMASHRFGDAEADNIFSSFDDEERECIVKKCLKYHCEKAGLVVVEQKKGEGSLEQCHVALVDLGETWHVFYGGLLDSDLFHENPDFSKLVAVFEILGADHHPLLEISATKDDAGFFTDGSGTDYIALARRRDFWVRGDGEKETGAEFKARRGREEQEKQEEGGGDSDESD